MNTLSQITFYDNVIIGNASKVICIVAAILLVHAAKKVKSSLMKADNVSTVGWAKVQQFDRRDYTKGKDTWNQRIIVKNTDYIESEVKRVLMNSSEYISIVEKIKSEITSAQYRAAVHVNADMLLLYYDIGCVINEHKTWGNKFIDNLASDIRMAFPESKGYSVRNLKYMAKFAETYPNRKFVQ